MTSPSTTPSVYDSHVAAAGRRERSVWRNLLLPTLIMLIIGMGLTGIFDVLFDLLIHHKMTDSSGASVSSMLSMIVSMAIGLWVIKKCSKVSPAEIGFRRADAAKGILGGIIGGGAAISITFIVSLMSDSINLSDVYSGKHLSGIIVAAIFFAFQGTYEEIFFRSYLMPQYSQYMGPLVVMLVTSAIFAAGHGLNGNMSTLGMINLFVFGMVFAVAFYRTGNTWLTGLGHGAWNFVLGIVYGSHVSGVLMDDTILQSLPAKGRDLISGGQYGMEGSIVSTIVGLLIIAALWRRPSRRDNEHTALTQRSAPTQGASQIA